MPKYDLHPRTELPRGKAIALIGETELDRGIEAGFIRPLRTQGGHWRYLYEEILIWQEERRAGRAHHGPPPFDYNEVRREVLAEMEKSRVS